MTAAACASSASGAVITASQVITSFTLRFSTVPVRPRSRRRATAERRSANAGANTASRTSRSEIMPTSLSASLMTGRCRTPRLHHRSRRRDRRLGINREGHPGHHVFHACRHGVLPSSPRTRRALVGRKRPTPAAYWTHTGSMPSMPRCSFPSPFERLPRVDRWRQQRRSDQLRPLRQGCGAGIHFRAFHSGEGWRRGPRQLTPMRPPPAAFGRLRRPPGRLARGTGASPETATPRPDAHRRYAGSGRVAAKSVQRRCALAPRAGRRASAPSMQRRYVEEKSA
jgi:hypothetical protein